MKRLTVNDKYCMDERNGYAIWKCTCEKNDNVIRVCMQVKELVIMRDKCVDKKLNMGGCNEIIKRLSIEQHFYD